MSKPNITVSELLKHYDWVTFSTEMMTNFVNLFTRINKLREHYGQPMVVTSGYRDPARNKRVGGRASSLHTKAAAVDISDLQDKLWDWINNNSGLLDECDLYCYKNTENRCVHFQVIPPKSGKRIFLP